jgi:hypothetical protein
LPFRPSLNDEWLQNHVGVGQDEYSQQMSAQYCQESKPAATTPSLLLSNIVDNIIGFVGAVLNVNNIMMQRFNQFHLEHFKCSPGIEVL